LGDLRVDGRILVKEDQRVWTTYIWTRIWASGGFYEHGNKFFGFDKMQKFSLLGEKL
jgi:hypothetical protein